MSGLAVETIVNDMSISTIVELYFTIFAALFNDILNFVDRTLNVSDWSQSLHSGSSRYTDTVKMAPGFSVAKRPFAKGYRHFASMDFTEPLK